MNRTKVNRKADIEIKKQAEAMEITSCEIKLNGCKGGMFLQRVHRHKRRYYYDKPDELLWDIKQWVIGCGWCHSVLEVDNNYTEEIFLRLRGKE
jgi:hypothetical protein